MIINDVELKTIPLVIWRGGVFPIFYSNQYVYLNRKGSHIFSGFFELKLIRINIIDGILKARIIKNQEVIDVSYCVIKSSSFYDIGFDKFFHVFILIRQ